MSQIPQMQLQAQTPHQKPPADRFAAQRLFTGEMEGVVHQVRPSKVLLAKHPDILTLQQESLPFQGGKVCRSGSHQGAQGQHEAER